MTFGERPNPQGWAPVSKEAFIVSWSDTEIVVTVPSMSPGKAGYPRTHHPVYVTVNGVLSESVSFYMDPVAVNPTLPDATWDLVSQTYRTDSVWGVELPTCDGYLFERVAFEATNGAIDGTAAGVLTLGQHSRTVQNVTFLDCTVKGNTGPGGPAYDAGVNAVKMIRNVRDVSFVGGTFETCSRMALETWTGGVQNAIVNNALIDVTFEPTGSLAISLVGGGNYRSKWLIDGCLFKGGNWGTVNSHWGGMLELRQAYVEVRDTDYWRAKSGYFNLGGFGDEQPTHWYFKGVNVDVTQAVAGAPTGRLSGATLFHGGGHREQSSPYPIDMAQATQYMLWEDCHFNTGSLDTAYLESGAGGVWNVGGYNLNAEVGWSHNHLPGCTVEGTTYLKPTRGYWVIDADTCIDNVWPEEVTA